MKALKIIGGYLVLATFWGLLILSVFAGGKS